MEAKTVKNASNSPKPWMGLLTRNIREENGKIIATGKCLLRLAYSRKTMDTSKLRIDFACKKNSAKLSFSMKHGIPGPKRSFLNSYRIEIDIEEAKNYDIQNKFLLIYDEIYEGSIAYAAFDRHVGRNLNGPLFIHDGITLYIKQNIYNRTYLTVRDTNRYDYPQEQERLKKAKKKSKKFKDKDIVYMYEKNCRKYEESAAVLYEKLIDMGYDNVYFIVDKSISDVQSIPEKYKKNLIDKDSDKHLEYFFASEKFISTETIDHALQLRIANKDALDKITKEPLEYVFLQHGPTYMISLNKDLRSGFRKKSWFKLHKTVVSSELEAQHFLELGGMERSDLYITGMAKFDRSYRNENADKIIIMPTWRRWETNQAREDITKTRYFSMIELMYNAVPEELRDKVVILPHPLMAERFNHSGKSEETAEMFKHIVLTDNYDNMLRECDTLITDYSSISYDAFYRGSNVIFYWAEKDECMTHYGEGTHLMLNAENVFGPICMREKEITDAVKSLYGTNQKDEYVNRYRNIIEFHDGKNSERIINHLIEDGVLKKHRT